MKAALAILIGVAVSSPGWSTTIFTDETAFTDAVPAYEQIAFAGLAPIDGMTSFGHTLNVPPVTFQDGEDNLTVVDPGFTNGTGTYDGWSLFGVPVLNDNYGYVNDPSVISVQLPAGVVAAGMTISIQPGVVGEFFPVEATGIGTITLSDGESTTFALDSSTRGFIGFTSDTPITSFTVSTPSFGLLTSEVLYSSVTPEPASWLCVGLGLALLFGGASKREHSN